MLKERLHKILVRSMWVLIIGLSLVLVANTLPYYWMGKEWGMLPEKEEHWNSLTYMIIFYAHVGPSILCLCLPMFQFMVRVVGKNRLKHINVGRWYVWVTLLLVCPTGIYLALFAKGGAVGQYGFMLNGLILAYFTWKGYTTIRKKKLQEHIEWMVRSYAVVTAALTFRVLHIAFQYSTLTTEDGYAASQWLSLCINILLGELVVSYIRKRMLAKTKPQPIQNNNKSNLNSQTV